MSIRVVCPNGHVLRAKDSCAGQVALCPVCKAQIQVAAPSNGEFSEDAILGILGPHEPGRSQNPAAPEPARSVPESAPTTGATSPPKKSCSNCSREIPTGTHICPYCHTYIAGLADL